MKEYKTIILEESNSVGILKLNRPKKLNAFNMQMLEDMLDAIDLVNKNDNLKSLIIAGNGKALPLPAIIKDLRLSFLFTKSIASSMSSNICILKAFNFFGLLSFKMPTEFDSSRMIVLYSFNKIKMEFLRQSNLIHYHH